MQVDATVHESDAERDTGSLESRNPLTGRLELNRVQEFDEFSLSKEKIGYLWKSYDAKDVRRRIALQERIYWVGN